ncbi:hypothetical protein NIES4102_19890 [Chondrocystis sp. NIES-4102]|nr:hypothetical protein NIES4102_19890 [Chondrocystis sp. NIES-4102]
MSQSIKPVWINANPNFKHFESRIIRSISQQIPLTYWEYQQEQDEASSIDIALDLLNDYLSSNSQAVDLIGHGVGGILSLLYARRYPDKVKSLTLLAVGYNPGCDWQAHYYQMRKLLPCSQEIILSRLVQMMFGEQDRANTLKLVKILQKDLLNAPTSHSLFQPATIDVGGVSMPLMVCGSENDGIVDRFELGRWSECLKPEDTIWINPLGHHFFHYFFPEQTSQQILKFWQNERLSATKEQLSVNI